MSDATETQVEEVDLVSANKSDSEDLQSAVSPIFEPPPFVDTRTDEQKAADERLKKQIEEYHTLYERGDIGETSLNSLILHRLAGRFSVIRELQRAFTGEILRLMKPESECGQGLTLQEAMPELFTHWERKKMERLDGRYEWVPPRVTDQDAIEHAAQMADRFRRQYLSALRALRDYRRWGAPVIINNEGQVNFAADGGQQVNLQKKGRGKKRTKKADVTTGRLKRKRANKPKQLDAKSTEESIQMEPASECVLNAR